MRSTNHAVTHYMSHVLFITSYMIWSPKHVTFHEEHKSCSHPLFNLPLLFCPSLLGPAIFCLLIITPKLSSLTMTDKFLYFYLFIVHIFTQKMNIISIDQKLMCPIQFQSLLVYSEMKLKQNGDKTCPCCRLFWTGSVSDMMALLDPTMYLFKRFNWHNKFCGYAVLNDNVQNRLMFCYIVFTFSLLVLTNAGYLIGVWSIMLKFTPIATKFLRGFNPLNPKLNPICYLLALLAHHFLHVSRIRVKSLTLRLLMYIYGAPILDVSRSHTTTQHSR